MTQHSVGLQTVHISGPGNFTGATTIAATTTQSLYFLTGVEICGSERTRAIVTLGDSVTDGFGSTADTNQRWPNVLAERLQADPSTSRVAVLTPASAAIACCTISSARTPWPDSIAMCWFTPA
jgi:hypothetical protein